jgi:hypothetical protein
MLLIIVVFIIVVLFYYWITILNMVNIIYNNTVLTFGKFLPWFIGILIINIIICSFINWIYYSKNGANSAGIKGSMGPQGFAGEDGPSCIFPNKG